MTGLKPICGALALGLGLLAGACATGASEPTRAGNPSEGQRVALDLCASCHAIGPTGDSPVAAAPVFRTILAGYNPSALTADLKRAAAISHRNMPTFYMSDQHAEDLVAYLVSLQPRIVE